MLVNFRIKPCCILLLLLLVPESWVSAQGHIISEKGQGVVSVWSQMTIQSADAYSSFLERAVEDCLRPKRVDCFSIQQNSWISNSKGDYVMWAQNAVELAKTDGSTYYGTYTFQVWNSSTTKRPLLCEPEASSSNSCRVPFYADSVQYPESFTFHTHISNEGSQYLLQMVNDFGAVSWKIPASIPCPCYIELSSDISPPWGQSPVEFVAVGLDSSSIAVFRNNTLGSFAPVLVELTDGRWHETTTKVIHCPLPGNCQSVLATGESSQNLLWNSTTGKFHWSYDASDQGVYISGASNGVAAAPRLPNPVVESYLYAEFRSMYAYLTIYDEAQRGLGVDPRSGKRVEEIPNSTIAHNSSEDLLIKNPQGVYDLAITAGGNTAFNLFVSKTTNTINVPTSQNYDGTLSIGHSKNFHLDVERMTLSSDENVMSSQVVPIAGIVLVVIGFLAAIAGVLLFRRRHGEE